MEKWSRWTDIGLAERERKKYEEIGDSMKVRSERQWKKVLQKGQASRSAKQRLRDIIGKEGKREQSLRTKDMRQQRKGAEYKVEKGLSMKSPGNRGK